MIIAVSSKGKELESRVSPVFGRAKYFIIVKAENGKIKDFKAIENNVSKQTRGAGVLAAKIVAQQKATALISGNLGPRASNILKQFKIKHYKSSNKVKQAVLEII